MLQCYTNMPDVALPVCIRLMLVKTAMRTGWMRPASLAKTAGKVGRWTAEADKQIETDKDFEH